MPSVNVLPVQDTAPPERIGRFAILRLLGEGTTGKVYLARDPLIDREVAIKLLRSPREPRARPWGSERLLNEGRAAGRLSHPGIVTIFEAGYEGDTPYLVMEFLDGADLSSLLAQGARFSFTETALIVGRLAQALAHAHRHAVVHRDIKPANIFMVSRAKPKLLDFGIARAPDRLRSPGMLEHVPYTMFHNDVLGTPQYMSPEQAMGQPADARSDLYALGAVMYELLAGCRPFHAETITEVLELVANRSPRPPHEIDRNIPQGLSAIAMKAMERNPARRYQHAHEMLTDIKRQVTHGRHGMTNRPSSVSTSSSTTRRPAVPFPSRLLPSSARLAVLTALLLL